MIINCFITLKFNNNNKLLSQNIYQSVHSNMNRGADTITAAVTGNTFVIEDGSKGECHGFAGESQGAPEPADETACDAAMGDWESPVCQVITFTKQ